jgi:hypothetical protein
MRLGKDEPLIRDIQVISTGSISLDIALGVGGVPRGRIVEIYGPESSGKTTLSLHVVAEAQKKGGICGYIDAEHALDVGYARKLGVRTDDLLLSQPDTGEQGLEIAEMLVRSGAIEPGAPQAHRHHRQEPDLRRLHQPDPDEDRRDVRQSGDHHRRQRAEVLRQPAAGHPPHRGDQER